MSPTSSHAGPFAARQPLFTHGGLTIRIALPASADELIDECAFERDERLPYWADLWPSTKALARFVIDHPPGDAANLRVLELGCGAAALASLALAGHGFQVLATDYEQAAVDIVGHNAAINNVRLKVRLVDWRDPPCDLGRFDFILAADVMYEQRNAVALAEAIPGLLAPGGRFLLADPGRRYLPEFQMRMRQARFGERELAMIEERNDDPSKPATRVRILEFGSSEQTVGR